MRKLKFQYLEQNAKDKYVKSIVSDIDDAPIVTLKDNQDLLYANERKKEVLKEAKAALAARQKDVNALASLVEQGESIQNKLEAEVDRLGQTTVKLWI